MLLTGEPITAQEAYHAGLVTAVCQSDNLDAEIDKTINAIKSKSRYVIALGKRFYYKQISVDLRSAYDLGADVMVNNINSADGVEGVKGFVEKRKSKWNHE